ncbi:Positive regulator of purine utilization [Venturia nashicola]|uniref:Positive regulator of purine utilization n=1 Tax=Venturia nashicola TaxID=86259 RepID=A0A4Z1NL09_9PEZI|nr:Positive regulator of purine utilization [Venturia nashicola]
MYILPGRSFAGVRVRNEIESDFKLDTEGGVDEGFKAGVESVGEGDSSLKADIHGKPDGDGEADSAGDKDVDAKADADSKVNSDHNGDFGSNLKADSSIPNVNTDSSIPNVNKDPNINTNSTITVDPDPNTKEPSNPIEDTKLESNTPSNPHPTRPSSHQPTPSSRTSYKSYTKGTKTLTVGIITYNNGSQTTYTPPPTMDILGVDINMEQSPMRNMFIMSPLLFLGIVIGCVLMMTVVRGVWGRGRK